MRERIWRSADASYLRVLPALLGVTHRGYTGQLQRVMTDFGLDQSFAAAVGKLREHYGIEVPVSSLRAFTLQHARRLGRAAGAAEPANQLPAKGCARLVAEADGSFIAVVRPHGPAGDRRKKRSIAYREARLCACRAQGTDQAHYRASLDEVREVGRQWNACAKAAGRGLDSFVHVVSDGAEWIRRQADSPLGCDRHLLDFFHLCGYLKAAQPACAHNRRWYATQKNRLLNNRADKVLEALQGHLEAECVSEEEAPVRQAYRYVKNRLDQLDYLGTRAEQLPIGSGLIESGHKHVIQARMKIAGAAWLESSAEAMIQARALRASGQWNHFWPN